MNSLSEGVRRIVSVSMLTEGWDANTVTHVLGVRAFGTQLLCEQVVGCAESNVVLSTADIPTRTENAPIDGESVILTLDDLKKRREQEVAFGIARLVMQQYYPADQAKAAEGTGGDPAQEAGAPVWLFPQILGIVNYRRLAGRTSHPGGAATLRDARNDRLSPIPFNEA